MGGGKRRILEVYLNVIEWGPGIFGAEAAARSYFGVPASALTPHQAALMAAVLPNPDLSMTPEQPMVEMDVSENPFRDKIVKQPFQLKGGFLDVPTGPGLGVDLDFDWIDNQTKKLAEFTR